MVEIYQDACVLGFAYQLSLISVKLKAFLKALFFR